MNTLITKWQQQYEFTNLALLQFIPSPFKKITIYKNFRAFAAIHISHTYNFIITKSLYSVQRKYIFTDFKYAMVYGGYKAVLLPICENGYIFSCFTLDDINIAACNILIERI